MTTSTRRSNDHAVLPLQPRLHTLVKYLNVCRECARNDNQQIWRHEYPQNVSRDECMKIYIIIHFHTPRTSFVRVLYRVFYTLFFFLLFCFQQTISMQTLQYTYVHAFVYRKTSVIRGRLSVCVCV